MSDLVQRFLLEDLDIRGAVVRLTGCWEAIQGGRNYPPAVCDLLGQMSAIAAIISTNLKQAGRLTFQLKGPGRISLLVIDCTQDLNMRAYAQHEPHLPERASLRELLGDAHLTMTLDIESARQSYQSVVPVEADTIAGVFEHFLEQSEQQPALILLAASEEAVGGFVLQKLPGADLKDADGWNRATQLAHTLSRDELLELDAETLLLRLYHEEDVRIFAPLPVRHDFPPQPEKIHAMLRSIGREEVERILAEHGEVHVRDDLSNHDYRLTEDEARALFEQERPTLH